MCSRKKRMVSSMSVPKAMQNKYDEIAPLISEFCIEYLDKEYLALCLRLLVKLCRKRPSPLLAGRDNTWAAGVVYAIAANNFIFDKANPHHMTADQIADEFDLAASTAGNKAAEIRRMFDIHYANADWLLPSSLHDNPAVWMLSVNGFMVDIRDMPLEVQRLAFQKGFIPYVPGDGDVAVDHVSGDGDSPFETL